MSSHRTGDGPHRRRDGQNPSPNDNPENGRGRSNAPPEQPQRPFDATLPEGGQIRRDAHPNGRPFDATFLNRGPGQANGELRQVNRELGQANGERQVRPDAGVRWFPDSGSEYPSSFLINRVNRSVFIRIYDERRRELYSRTLDIGERSSDDRVVIFDSDQSRSNVIEYYEANENHGPQLHQTIYEGDINTIIMNYDQIMNGDLDDEARERRLNSYLLERRVYTLSNDSFRITSYDSDGYEREHVDRFGGQ